MQLATAIDRLLSKGREIWSHRLDLQVAFPSPESPEFWEWLGTHGFIEYPETRLLWPSIPPEDVRQYSSTGGEWGYLLTGASTYRLVSEVLRDHSPSELSSSLDFGCGPGRALRFMVKHAASCALSGCDVDAKAIAWCQEHLPYVDFRTNAEEPPLPWSDHAESFRRLMERGGIASFDVYEKDSAGRLRQFLWFEKRAAPNRVMEPPARN